MRDHDHYLISKTREKFAELTRAVAANEQPATKRITDALGDYLADDHAFAELVRASMTDSTAFAKVRDDAIWGEAIELTDAEAAGAEQRRAESRADNLIHMAEFDHALA